MGLRRRWQGTGHHGQWRYFHDVSEREVKDDKRHKYLQERKRIAQDELYEYCTILNGCR